MGWNCRLLPCASEFHCLRPEEHLNPDGQPQRATQNVYAGSVRSRFSGRPFPPKNASFSGKYRGLFLFDWNVQREKTEWRWTQSVANCSPGRNSLVSGKFTGNLSCMKCLSTGLRPVFTRSLKHCVVVHRFDNREFKTAYQGMNLGCRRVSANYSLASEEPAPAGRDHCSGIPES